MKLLKLALPCVIFTAVIAAGGMSDTSWSEAQAASPVSQNIAARDTPTPAEDIALTNSCIEAGQEKIYCVCKTKIFKNEMSLRDYRGAVALSQSDNSQAKLSEMGYSADDTAKISKLSETLTRDDTFRTRCDMAETYFAAGTAE